MPKGAWRQKRLKASLARHIATLLTLKRPNQKDYFATRLANFERTLTDWDTRLQQQWQQKKLQKQKAQEGQKQPAPGANINTARDVGTMILLADHPSWHYFARHYGLTFETVAESGREAKAQQVLYVMRLAQQVGLNEGKRNGLIFLESPRHALLDQIAQKTGIPIVLLRPDQPDVFALWQTINTALERAR